MEHASSKPVDIFERGGAAAYGVIFKVQLLLFLAALLMTGFGNVIFGVVLPTNVSTICILLSLFVQLASGVFRIQLFLILIFIYVVIHTFLFNYNEALFVSSAVHFTGLILFSITAFSFISAYRYRILYIIKMYYRFCFVIACIAIIQSIVFMVFNKTISFQYMLNGPQRPEMTPELFGFFPRSPGIASEPATFSIILMPGMYLSLLVLVGRGQPLLLKSRIAAIIILTSFMLTFSLVGYMALILSIVLLAIRSSPRTRLAAIFVALSFVSGVVFLFSNTIIVAKLTGLYSMAKNHQEYRYTTNDLSGFALISNLLVAREAMLQSYYLGTGLNTHESRYNETIEVLFDRSQIIYELNKKDAGSLFIRLASEFGVPGLAFLLFFILRYKLVKVTVGSKLSIINDMCFVVIVCSCMRSGNYFNIVFLLFSAMYFYSFALSRGNYRLRSG